jgi:hypothetical protein
LADVPTTVAGLDTTTALTPFGAASTYVAFCDFTAKGQLIASTAASAYGLVSASSDNLALVSCAACATGMTFASPLIAATPTALGAVYGIGQPGATANFSIGCTSLGSVTIAGCANTGVGIAALPLLTSGCYNVAVGGCALYSEVTGSCNTAVGTGALDTQNGASNNTAVGYGTGTAITIGSNNNMFGANAGCAVTTGCFNVLLGHSAGRAITTSCCNVIIGGGAGCFLTGGSNTFVGDLAGCNATSGNNNIVIGQSAVTSSATVSNEVTVGNSSNSSYRIYAASWSNASDARDKKDIEDLALGLDFVQTLRPVRYVWDYRGGSAQNGNPDIGFIAQELLEAQEQADADYAQFVNQSNPDQLMITQGKLIPVLVNAIKELKAEVEALKAQLG